VLYRLLADVVVLLHFGFIVFAAIGAVLLLRWPRLIWIHLPAAAWASTVVLFGWICPLTPLEILLREAAGHEGYDGSFIERYILILIYPPGLTRSVQVLLGSGVVLLNVALYSWWLWQRRDHSHNSPRSRYSTDR
jgi:hypothetical protein